MIKTKH